MKSKLVILFLVILTIINIAALVTIAYHRFHHRRPFRPIGRPDMHMDFIKQELDLNEEQVKEFEAQIKRLKMETEPIFDSLQAKRTDLMDEIAAEEPNVERLNQLIEEISVLEVRLKKKSIMHLLEGRSLLTPEQQKKFFTLFREGMDRMKGWRGRGRGIGRWPGHPDFEDGK